MCALGSVALGVWIIMTYFMFVHRPDMVGKQRQTQVDSRLAKLSDDVQSFSIRLKQQINDNAELLEALESIKSQAVKDVAAAPIAEPAVEKKPVEEAVDDSPVIPVLMFSCNRPTVSKAIDPLLEYRGSDPERIKKFPIIVSQVRTTIICSTLHEASQY